MLMSGPFKYRIQFDVNRIISVEAPDGGTRFSGPANERVPKLYVVSNDSRPVYVGVTKQPIRTRLRLGFQSDSGHGYHGYAWRHHLRQANVDIWLQKQSDGNMAEIETVEAEVVFLIRQVFDQWPEHQTEIHFHPSDEITRQVAMGIVDHYLPKTL